MKKILNYCNCFTYITTGILFVCAINFSLFHNGDIPQNTLWQILVSGFLTTAITVFLFPWNIDKTQEFVLRIILHYFCLCAVMIGCGIWFNWIDFGFKAIIRMAISVAGVYILTFFLNYIMGKKQAEEINQALSKRRSKE